VRSVTLLYRKFVAIVAASLLAAGPSRPKAIPLGTVTQAEQAHLGATEASVGSTIYDGDRLSTDSGGVLRASGIALTLQLDSNSSVTLRGTPVPEGDIQAELGSGTVIFSSGQASNIAVLADGALIRPAAHAFTVAHIRVTSPKELRIYAQRGALDFSYHGQRNRCRCGIRPGQEPSREGPCQVRSANDRNSSRRCNRDDETSSSHGEPGQALTNISGYAYAAVNLLKRVREFPELREFVASGA